MKKFALILLLFSFAFVSAQSTEVENETQIESIEVVQEANAEQAVFEDQCSICTECGKISYSFRYWPYDCNYQHFAGCSRADELTDEIDPIPLSSEIEELLEPEKT